VVVAAKRAALEELGAWVRADTATTPEAR
jgi:hypothetical protein